MIKYFIILLLLLKISFDLLDPDHLSPYQALYSFTARNPDELSIQAGELVMVSSLPYFNFNISIISTS